MGSFTISILAISLWFSVNLHVVRGEVRSNSRCVDVSLECEYREKYCSVPAYAGLMYKICRFTCDWCQKSLNDVIHSNRRSIDGVLADIPEWLTANPSTPENIEGSGSTVSISRCMDLSRSCESTLSLCQAPSYQIIMAKKCPKTCGLCE